MSVVSKLMYRFNAISYSTPAGPPLGSRCYLSQIPMIQCLSHGLPTLVENLRYFYSMKGLRRPNVVNKNEFPSRFLADSGKLPFPLVIKKVLVEDDPQSSSLYFFPHQKRCLTDN